MAQALWLSELEARDPRATSNGRERRFLCPFLACNSKGGAAHRSLSVNTQTGVFVCYRCEASGKLADFWEERPKLKPRDFTRQQLARVCALPAIEADATPSAEATRKADELQTQLKGLRPLEGTSGAAYLLGRGLPLDVCVLAGARFSPTWPQWSKRGAVYFPLHNRAGELVAAQGRYVDGRDDPKTRTIGDKKAGLFSAPTTDGFKPFDAATPAVILTEAPIDALSFAAAGFPAIGLCGKTGPDWLPKACFSRRVILAFDADDAGDQAAQQITATLESLGANCRRLRPEGAKDWNEFLQLFGRDTLADFVSKPILMEATT